MNSVLTPFLYAFDDGVSIVDSTVTTESELNEENVVDDEEFVVEWEDDQLEEIITELDDEEELDEDVVEKDDDKKGWEHNSAEWDEDELDENELDENVIEWEDNVKELDEEENKQELTWSVQDEEEILPTKNEVVAVIAKKLWIDWEEEAQYYAQLAWIEDDYYWTKEQNEKIRDFLVDNAEWIMNWEYEEIIEKMKAEEKNKDKELNKELDNDLLTWKVLSWDVSKIKDLTWDMLTWSLIEIVEKSVEENLEEFEALKNEELKQAWTTLNGQELTWQDMYKDVIVTVEAPKGSFPEWTELRITPITGKDEMREIKDQLVENTDVTEESELVSFDISFIYTLSFNWEEVELQPYTWETVKVSFNYLYNDDLVEADEDDNKELKVYHLEEVLDDDGNKTDEVEVTEIEINEKESSEWELVVDAEKFSVYTVADVDVPVLRDIKSSSQNITTQNPSWTRSGIQVTLDDWSCLWIMNKNLWATSTSDVGYYYQ